jgi:predicted nucleotidyltransferase
MKMNVWEGKEVRVMKPENVAALSKVYTIEKVKESLTPLFEEDGLQLILLFGSTVSGKQHRGSDIDLGFLFDKPTDVLDLINKATCLLKTDRVDVVDLRRASSLLKYAIVKKGHLLFERSAGLFNAFYVNTLKRYLDARFLRESRQNVIDHFLKERGFQ